MAADPRVSVVIPTVNRPEAIVDVARDFLAQEYPAFEVIVVDQNPSANPELERLQRADGRLRVVRTLTVGTCHARNLGVRHATGEIVVYVDDDCRIEQPQFLASHARNYVDPAIGGVGGRVIDRNDQLNREQSGPVCTVTKTGRVYPNATSRTRQFINAPRGGNMSFRKSVIERVGGFDERFRGNAMREETDFSLRVVKSDWKIVYDPDPENVHLALHGGTRSIDRISWYEDFFFNEFLFFRKNFPARYLPLLLLRKLRPILACMVYYGRLRPRALLAPLRGMTSGWRLGSRPYVSSPRTA